MTTPVTYSMCCQTITVYRKTVQGIVRQEIPNCYFRHQEETQFNRVGPQGGRPFFLVQPGVEQLVFPGDRVMEGVGPEVTEADWAAFLPVNVPGLVVVAYATAFHWEGEYCHTEAGRK